jgi:cobalt/nickel transport system permease protein
MLSPAAMHIPDGFLSVMVSIIFWVLSIIAIAVSLKRVNRDLGEKEVPLMGVLAAAIFAGQMLNFTVVGGTSGHLLGAALATILVGPWAAVLVMTSVVATQALIFQDGGILVLGANIFNMSVVGVAVSYAVYQLVLKLFPAKKIGVLVAGFIAAWTSIVLASLLVALQLALSGTFAANLAVPAMGGIHALIGIGEGLITLGALAFVYAARPDLLKISAGKTAGNRTIIIAGVAIAVLLAVLSPLASSDPDGLEWVAEEYGFLQTAQEPFYNIIPDYVFPGLENEVLATIVAGVIGVIIVLGVAWGIAYSRRQKATS